MNKPSRVVIVGGTHGNEWTGIQVVKYYQQHLKAKFPSLELGFLFANPEAYASNERFKEEDLNRAFEFLHEERSTYEHKRAHEIKKNIQSSPCFVIDLHTTTSNMGKTVIVSQYNPINLSVCHHLQNTVEDCRIIAAPDSVKKYLISQSNHGLIIEVGPIANSVVGAEALESTMNLVEIILEFLSSSDYPSHKSVELYEEFQDVHYPVNEKGELTAYVHSKFQGSDFHELEGVFTPFRSFEGKEIEMRATQKLYPIFINEAAYYPVKLAFTLCRKVIKNF